ncbi:ABC transporter permease subunit [Clostridium sp. MCC353]|uniref:carbohydrate ABC transporter permease n=1 Tax=Clostridium sp. MCC353 TaxID=2592646 RepID=UPI001C029237|nr:carbohydrate ABC transporter permease [Clostridium sp. MCC353]MBT9775820.1 ABC transporter permease subunit [Clostridium sp. MCC353]
MSYSKKKILNSVIVWAITGIVAFIILVPLYWIFISSITPESELFTSPINYIPKHPTLKHYSKLFLNLNLGKKMFNTLFITCCALSISTVICLLAAYGFNRYESRGLKAAQLAIVFSMMVPAIVKARPLYTFFRSVGLLDTFPGLILIYTSNLIPFTMLILGNFLTSIPISIEEAAEVDGAGFTHKFFYVTLPLMKPAVATILMINFITCLNDLFTPLYYSNSIEVLSVAITTLPKEDMYSMPWELISSMGWVIVFPIIIFVCVFEKNIMDGIMAGGVKS